MGILRGYAIRSATRLEAKWGHDLCDLDLQPLTLTFCIGIISVIANYSWKYQDDTLVFLYAIDSSLKHWRINYIYDEPLYGGFTIRIQFYSVLQYHG